MKPIGKSAPWFTFYHKIEALLGKDPEIELTQGGTKDPNEQLIVITAKTNKKADALRKLLPTQKQFGNIYVTVRVESKENSPTKTPEQLLKDAFENNPVVESIVTTNPGSVIAPTMTYVEFANEVVQFFDDRLDDPRGNVSTLYQDIAKDVLMPGNGVAFCTAAKETIKSAKPEKVIKSKNDYSSLGDEIDKLIRQLKF